MTQQDLQLDLRIETSWGADDETLITLAADLHDELAGLHRVASVNPTTAGPAPPGTRAAELFVAGALTVILARSFDDFLGVMDKIRSWIDAFQDGRDVKIIIDGNELKATKISRKTQRELIQFYKDCVKRGDGTNDGS